MIDFAILNKLRFSIFTSYLRDLPISNTYRVTRHLLISYDLESKEDKEIQGFLNSLAILNLKGEYRTGTGYGGY